MKFSLFDTTSWPYGEADSDYDPERAAELLERHLAEYVRAEELGYDGVFIAEHHFSPYNLTPNPNIMLAALAQRTSRIRIGAMVNVVTFSNPIRLAEEIAMVDLLSGGRLEVGIGRGVDEQEFLKFKVPYQEARGRFEESLELMLRLWSEEGVEHDGRYYQLGTATLWPRPLQRPHPPIWIAALSDATIQWAARHGYPMASAFLPPDITGNRFDVYRRAAEESGRTPKPADFALLRFVHVADTDEQAVDQARGAMGKLFKLFIPAVVPRDLSALPEEYAYYKDFFAPFQDPENPPPLEVLMDLGIVVAGSPDTVARNLRHQAEVSGTGHLLSWHHFGDLDQSAVLRSEELYAEKVMPTLADLP